MHSGTLLRRITNNRSINHKDPQSHSLTDQNSTKKTNTPSTPATQAANTISWRMSVLPRNNNYKRVDSGDGPGRIRRFGWKKFAIGASVIIGLVWLFGPRERRDQVLGGIKRPTWGRPNVDDVDYDPLPPPPSPTLTRPPAEHSEVLSEDPVPTLPTAPHSPEDDLDLTKTVHCLTPYKPDLPLVQYALMIDAGSTGSRIHIYKFNNCGPSAAYEYEVFKQTQPGLSSYKSDAQGAAESLDVLLDKAVEVVPESLRSCTPVAVKATAGLRMLGADQSANILEAVRTRLSDNYPFALVEKDGVVIMDGKDEGVYAWITANYLLNTISGDAHAGTPPYAVLDLGGASTQIVFQPTVDAERPESALAEGDHKYELQFGGKTHTLYQHSYLGYGLMQARKSVHRLVEFMWTFNKNAAPALPGDDYPPMEGEIANPCLAKGTTKVVELEARRSGEVKRNVTMAGKDVGGYEACNRIVELVMAKDAICEVKPCSFNGVYQPSILDTFPNGKILLLSYFFDRIAPFFAAQPDEASLTVSTLADLAHDVCLGPASWAARWDGDETLLRELEDRPEWCLDLTFMHALLRLGYEFGDEREVRVGKQVDGTELGWCLGATIAIVGGELTCRV